MIKSNAYAAAKRLDKLIFMAPLRFLSVAQQCVILLNFIRGCGLSTNLWTTKAGRVVQVGCGTAMSMWYSAVIQLMIKGVKPDGVVYRSRLLYRKHRKFFLVGFGLIAAYLLLNSVGIIYRPVSPEVLLSKETANSAKSAILSLGAAAPAAFIGIQTVQVIAVPIPGQVIGLVGGFIFGWKFGVLYTMIGLSLGMWAVFTLSRKLGPQFVERLNGREALKDFETLFVKKDGQNPGMYGKSKEALRSHGLLTFFMIMLLPGLPDNLACFVAGLSRIRIWKLMVAGVVGRFPAMLMLCFFGDGWSNATSSSTLYFLAGIALLLTLIYLWKKQQIEALMRRIAGTAEASTADR